MHLESLAASITLYRYRNNPVYIKNQIFYLKILLSVGNEDEDEYEAEGCYLTSCSSSKTVFMRCLLVIYLDEGQPLRRSRRTGLGTIFGI